MARGREVKLCHGNEELTWQALYLAVLALLELYSKSNDIYMLSSGKDHSRFSISTANVVNILTLREKLRQDPRGICI